MTGAGMAGFSSKDTKTGESTVTADFRHALMEEVMRTEQLRIKALIATAALFAAVLLVLHFAAP